MSIQYQNQEWDGKKVIVGETPIQPEGPVKLLIGFHGADSTPENMLIYGNKLTVQNALMVYPEGPIDAGKGLWSWWEDGPRQKQAVARFVEFASGMVEASFRFLDQKYPGAEGQICLWGFSQGAAASLVYSLFGGHDIHRVASICGFLPEIPDEEPARPPIHILGIFGANDDVVPSFLADHALEEMKSRGHHLIARETGQRHEVNADNLKEVSEFFNS
ncbi:MAG: phospholipase [Nitrospinae bacterium CG11_big_fil_rev_8_21_14_0_20_56_8]|nr:MAG: phospholipase [Nitrospinae bacterium CG11_big_fil_rev_8_21_14_0_20_56_8]